MTADTDLMQRALELAANAVYDTDPNPAVGCVIAVDGEIVGEGWTQPAGGAHAEIVALQAAGSRAAGATAWVTLEPCCHTGRTGPCTSALIEAGIAQVVYAIDDPNDQVAGRGAQLLRAAGVEVLAGVCAEEARRLNAGFISRMSRGRPWVRVKIAASLDGRTALSNGVSQWITGDAARADVHRWRARSSAVLTGSGTVLADDSRLSARPQDLDHGFIPPLRVVLDSTLRVPPDARMFADASPVLIVTCSDTKPAADLPDNADVVKVRAADGKCDLPAVLELLAAREINSVWVEAGRTLSGALLQSGLIDELFVYSAPVVLGDQAMGMFAIDELCEMSQRPEFTIDDYRQIGDDLRLVFRPSNVTSP